MKTNCHFQLKWRDKEINLKVALWQNLICDCQLPICRQCGKCWNVAMLKCCSCLPNVECNFQFGQFMRMNDPNPQSTRSSRLTPTAQADNPFVSAKRMLKRIDRCLLASLWRVVLHSPPTEMTATTTQPRAGQWTGHWCRGGEGSVAHALTRIIEYDDDNFILRWINTNCTFWYAARPRPVPLSCCPAASFPWPARQLKRPQANDMAAQLAQSSLRRSPT